MSDPINTKIPSDTEILYARSIIYQMLAFFFRHPGEITDISLIQSNVSLWRDAVKTVGLTDHVIDEFERATLRAWKNDYEKFLGHTVNSMAPAYELEYGEAHSHREPQALADITAFYNAFGLKVAQYSHERADHVSIECEFMHYLLYKEAVAIEEGTPEQVLVTREAAGNFLKIHLGYWLPSFAKRLGKISDGLVKAVADFAFEFVSEDCRFLGVETGPPDLPVRTIQEKEDAGCVSCEFKSTPHS